MVNDNNTFNVLKTNGFLRIEIKYHVIHLHYILYLKFKQIY